MMNKNIFFYAFTCIYGMFLLSSCDKSDTLKSSTNTVDEIPIQFRDYCPPCYDDDQCCCTIEINLATTNSGTIRMCGIINGTSGTCPQVSGCLGSAPSPTSYQDITFSTLDPREPFCVYEGQAGFWIMNIGLNSIDLKMTCHSEQFNPVYTNFTLASNERVYYRTEPDCDLVPCQ